MTVLIKSYLSEQDPGKYENQSFEYTLTHSSGASFSVINFGAVITKIMVPDRSGRFDDVELGYKGLDGYLDNRSWHGANMRSKERSIIFPETTVITTCTGETPASRTSFGMHVF